MKTFYNKKAQYNYYLQDFYEVGIELKGTEIKSIRAGHIQIKDAHGIIKNKEIFLLNMHIAPYEFGNRFNHDPLRTRRLLLHQKQINKIIKLKKSEKITLVPTKLYFKNGWVKIELATATGKKQHDKRRAIKEKDQQRAARKLEKYR